MQCGVRLPLKQDVQHFRMLMHKSDAWAIGIAIHPEDAATHLHKQPGTAIRHLRSHQAAGHEPLSGSEAGSSSHNTQADSSAAAEAGPSVALMAVMCQPCSPALRPCASQSPGASACGPGPAAARPCRPPSRAALHDPLKALPPHHQTWLPAQQVWDLYIKHNQIHGPAGHPDVSCPSWSTARMQI